MVLFYICIPFSTDESEVNGNDPQHHGDHPQAEDAVRQRLFNEAVQQQQHAEAPPPQQQQPQAPMPHGESNFFLMCNKLFTCKCKRKNREINCTIFIYFFRAQCAPSAIFWWKRKWSRRSYPNSSTQYFFT